MKYEKVLIRLPRVKSISTVNWTVCALVQAAHCLCPRTGLLSQYRQAQDRLAETREKYREASSGITERSRRLADLGDELEHIKQQMEERGVSLTDGGLSIKSTRQP